MSKEQQRQKIASGKGFIAALDQSGGSTPKALKQYGVEESAYNGEDEMFAKVHEMRTRIITAAPFNGEKILGAILFEKTMDNVIEGTPTAEYLWNTLQVVPFLKVDKGLADEEDGVQMMQPMPELSALLSRANEKGIFGTKMRSVINSASESGIAAIVAQQFEVASVILDHGLVPIIEPEVNINAADKAACEDILKAELVKHTQALPEGREVIFKLTLPETSNHYAELAAMPNTMALVALSGGYDLEEACKRLAANEGMIASFSRALSNDLHANQNDTEFDAALQNAIAKIYAASVNNEVLTQAA